MSAYSSANLLLVGYGRTRKESHCLQHFRAPHLLSSLPQETIYCRGTLITIAFCSDAPTRLAAYVPDVPTTLPLTRIVKDGEDGLSNDWRLREHWAPSVIWKNMSLIIPPVSNSSTFV